MSRMGEPRKRAEARPTRDAGAAEPFRWRQMLLRGAWMSLGLALIYGLVWWSGTNTRDAEPAPDRCQAINEFRAQSRAEIMELRHDFEPPDGFLAPLSCDSVE